MVKTKEKTDMLPGVLRAKAFKCNCTVSLVTKLTPGASGNAVWTSLHIASAEKTPPDGTYKLDVLGRIFKVRRESGQWPTLSL
jgi:hypothetical protein